MTRRWIGRPWLARAVRVVVYVVPFICSIIFAFALSTVLPLAHTWPVAVLRLIVIAALSTLVLYGADRLTRRLLPLAALLSLTLVFPDEAPSRFKIALRAGGTTQLKRRLADYRRIGADEPALAAQRILELVADLSRHDRLTRGHSERVRAYSQMIGEELGLSADEIDSLRWAALLHDIGKLETPFEILNKPGRLTAEEYETVMRHPGVGGAKLAAPLAGWLGHSVRAVGEHHERWDGKGYPNGLRGNDIALAARIVAVADTFDVMTSVRSYKKPGTAAEAREELARCAGTQFDADVVRAFLRVSLGKVRLVMGPISWLTQLALFPPGIVSATAATPALMAAAGMTAAALGTTVAPPGESTRAPQAIISVVDEPSGQTDPSTVTVSIPTEVSSQTTGPDISPVGTADFPNQVSASTVAETSPAQTTPTSAPRPATTVSTGGGVDQTVPVIRHPTLPPTTAAPTTPATTAGLPTTQPPTTVPSTTAPTTSSPAPPTGTYLLGSSAPGDVASRAVLPLVARGPLNTGALPNLDIDNDDDPGRRLKRDSLLRLGDPDQIQRFRLDPSVAMDLDGPASLILYAAAKDFRVDQVQTRAAVVDCGPIVGICTILSTATVTFTGDDDGFTPLTFDFGSLTRTVPASHNLEVWIIVTRSSDRDMWMAYDTTGYESALTLTL